MMKNKVMVIGLDGASPDIIQKALQNGSMPFLKKILGSGNNLLSLKSTIPSSTAPNWTSMMTGVNPGKHGIFDFLLHEGMNSRIASYSDVKKPFIWDILSNHDIKSVVIGHPLTYPIKKDKNIVMVSGILAPELNEKSVYPIDVLDILHSEKYNIDIEDKMPLLKSNPEEAVKLCNDSAIKRVNAVKKILKKYDWNFAFVLFPESDRLLHYHISNENLIWKHFEILDKAIEELISLDNNIIVFVTSDHGFVKIRKVFAVNSLLYSLELCDIVRNGKRVLALKYGRKIASKLGTTLIKLGITGNTFGDMCQGRIIKEKSKAWFTPYAESGIRLNPNLSEDDKQKIVDMLLKILDGLKDPSAANNIVAAFRRKDIYHGDAVNNAPDIILLPLKDYVATHVIPSTLGKILFDPDELFLKEGDHVCEGGSYGILAVHGIKINKNRNIPEIFDITPTILNIFGLKTDDYSYMDGKSFWEGGTI